MGGIGKNLMCMVRFFFKVLVLLKFVCTYNFEFEVKGGLAEMLNNPIKLHKVKVGHCGHLYGSIARLAKC